MIIDLHTHTFPDRIAASAVARLQAACRTRAFSDGTAGGLRASMDRSGVDCSVVLPVATSPGQVVRINDSALRMNERFPETGLLSLGCMHPDFDGWREELDRMAERGLRGLKIHPAYQAVPLDDPRYLRILDRAAQLGLVTVAHGGVDIGLPEPVLASPEMARRVWRELGSIPLVLAHMGGWRQWDRAEELLGETGFLLDTAFSFGPLTPAEGAVFPPEEREMMGRAQFLRFVRAFGPRRILFGTDSPWGDPAAELSRLRALPIPKEDLADILGGNAARLLKLRPTAGEEARRNS